MVRREHCKRVVAGKSGGRQCNRGGCRVGAARANETLCINVLSTRAPHAGRDVAQRRPSNNAPTRRAHNGRLKISKCRRNLCGMRAMCHGQVKVLVVYAEFRCKQRMHVVAPAVVHERGPVTDHLWRGKQQQANRRARCYRRSWRSRPRRAGPRRRRACAALARHRNVMRPTYMRRPQRRASCLVRHVSRRRGARPGCGTRRCAAG